MRSCPLFFVFHVQAHPSGLRCQQVISLSLTTCSSLLARPKLLHALNRILLHFSLVFLLAHPKPRRPRCFIELAASLICQPALLRNVYLNTPPLFLIHDNLEPSVYSPPYYGTTALLVIASYSSSFIFLSTASLRAHKSLSSALIRLAHVLSSVSAFP